jgi:tetratricopeptide (TPR) repeat protein
MEKAISLSQIGLYNPRRQSAEVTEKLFAVRIKYFNFILNRLMEEKANSIPQHHLIIGQRGMGKTTMLKRMEVELHKKQYRQQFIPLLFPEEQYNVKDIFEFWLNCLDALADSLESEKATDTIIAQIDNKIKNLLSLKQEEQTSEKPYRYLMDTCQKLKRRPVLLVDNISLLFNRLRKHEQDVLRALLSENGAPIIISAGITLSDDTVNYDATFYDFFQIHYLYKLSFEEFMELLQNLALATHCDGEMFSFLKKDTPRQKTLHQLTGGNPRTAVMLFKLTVKGFADDINDDLEALLDEITPLYKARFEELSTQQQIIVDAIAMNWDAISLNQLSKDTRYENNLLSPQLKRLTDDGWIETTNAYKAKGNAYFIGERFFNVWFLMRRSSRRQKEKIYCLSRFLECFYGKEKIEKISDDFLLQDICTSNQILIGLAMSEMKTLNMNVREKVKEKAYHAILELSKTDETLTDEFGFSKTEILSQSVTELFKKGTDLFKSQQYDEAIICFDKLIDILMKAKEYNKTVEDAKLILAFSYYNRGTAYIHKGEYDNAIEDYNKAIELKPDFAEAYNNRGNTYSDKGEYDNAIEDYNKAIKLKPDFAVAYNNRGNAYYYKGEYDNAIEDFNKAIELKPNYALAYYTRGIVYAIINEYDNAIEDYNKAIELMPNYALAYNNRGMAYRNKGEYINAIEDLNKALELKPDFAEAYNNRGIVYAIINADDNAIEDLNKAIELKPDFAEAYNTRGMTYYYKGEYDNAIEDYNKALELRPQNIHVKFSLIFLYRDVLDKMKEATELFNSINENEIFENEDKNVSTCFYLNKTLFELHKRDENTATEFLLQAFESTQKIQSIVNTGYWRQFDAAVIKLHYGSWLLNILEEKDYDIVLSPYYTAIQALEIERQDNNKASETYLKNRAIEISEPAREIIEKIKQLKIRSGQVFGAYNKNTY